MEASPTLCLAKRVQVYTAQPDRNSLFPLVFCDIHERTLSALAHTAPPSSRPQATAVLGVSWSSMRALALLAMLAPEAGAAGKPTTIMTVLVSPPHPPAPIPPPLPGQAGA
eukprot:COSAG04_NODE_148_length_22826_cov_11.360026_17_plen_111_part_00